MSCISGGGSSNTTKRKDDGLALRPQDHVSVATVILNHHLSNISDENVFLRKENKSMEEVRSVLTNINIHLGDIDDYDLIATLDLANGVIIDEKSFDTDEENDGITRLQAVPFHNIPPDELVGYKLLFSLKDAESIPLSDLMEIKVTRSNKTVGEFLGIHNEVFLTGEDVTITIQLSEYITMQGEITGLSHDDIERFRVGKMIDDEESDNSVARMIMEYLNVGTGLTGQDVEFVPFGFHMIISNNMKKLLDALRPMCCESPGEPSLFKGKFDASRCDIITAIGCNDTQKKVIEENKKLVVENSALRTLCDIIGTIGIHHSTGTFSIDLKEGACGVVSSDNRFENDKRYVWIVDLSEKDISVAAKDICECGVITLSGVPMRLVPPGIGMRPIDDDVDLMGIQLHYDNQTLLSGTFDSAIDAEDFVTSETPVKLESIALDFFVAKEIFDVLGMDPFELSNSNP